MRIKLSVIGVAVGLVLTVALVPAADARNKGEGGPKRIGVKDRIEKPTQTVQGTGSGGAKARTIIQAPMPTQAPRDILPMSTGQKRK